MREGGVVVACQSCGIDRFATSLRQKAHLNCPRDPLSTSSETSSFGGLALVDRARKKPSPPPFNDFVT